MEIRTIDMAESTIALNMTMVPVGYQGPKTINWSEQLDDAINSAIESFESAQNWIRCTPYDLVRILDCASHVGKGGVKGGMLNRLFKTEFRGIDRRRLVSWFETYSPIRIRFNPDGTFKDCAWSDAHVKSCKANGVPVFNINAARDNPWFEMGEAAKGFSLRGKTEDSIANTAIRAIVKATMVANPDGLFSMIEIERVMRKVAQLIGNGNEEALRYACSDSFLDWEKALVTSKKQAKAAGKAAPVRN